MAAILISLLGSVTSASADQLPNVLLVVVDDFGWADTGYHRAESNTTTPDLQTPTIDALVKDGVELDRHYVHMMCTPTRASLQSGREPVHILTRLAGPCDKNGAIPRNMTGIAQKMKQAGYFTHQVGKWDAGMVTPKHTPHGRGYDTSLNYFGHGNWMWTEAEWMGSYDHLGPIPEPGIIDFWDTDKPASHLNGTGYEEYIFRDRIQNILKNHNKSEGPLFLNYDSKIAHYPLQAPLEYQQKFAHIEDVNRRVYHSMVNFLDDQLRNITDSFKEFGLWDNTLMILTSDNGGYVKSEKGGCNVTSGHGSDRTDTGHGAACFNGEAGANNWPLRGGKYSMFEGGIRVNAFVSGGFLPKSVRGTKLGGMIHVSDWYGTLCGLAGVSPVDAEAAASGLPPVDSFDVWPMLSGKNLTSPRETILVTPQLLVHNQWKYVAGGANMIESARGGPSYPNASTAAGDPIDAHSFKCPKQGCLFNIVEDRSEFHEVSAQNPDLVAELKALMEEKKKTIWSTSHDNDPVCEKTAKAVYGGFYGPWKEI